MVFSPDFSPPVNVLGEFTSHQSKYTALTMVKHARRALDDHKPLNDSSIALFMHRLDENPALKQEAIDHVEAQLFEVPRRLFGGFNYFVLRWNEGEYRFAVTTAPSD